MKCYKCKREIDKKSKFCNYCGAKVENVIHDCIRNPEDEELHINEGTIMLCSNCGNRVDVEKKYTKLRIKCAEKKFHWAVLHYFVYLDKKIVGILHDDSYFIYHVLNGTHELLIRYVDSYNCHYYFNDIFTKEIEFNDNINSIDLFIADKKKVTMSENFKNSDENMKIKQICDNCKHEIIDNSGFCKYCGTKMLNENINNNIVVNNKDVMLYCPKCGKGIDKKEAHAILTIRRNYHKLLGVLNYYNIILDGKFLGPLANGDYLSSYVPVGDHELRIEPISHLEFVKKGSITQSIRVNESTNNVEVIMDTVAWQPVLITSIKYK